MTAEEERLKNRFLDLAERAYRHGIPVFSPFLSEQERALLLSMRRMLAGVSAACFGGIPDCERQMACFRPDTERDADVPFPIVCLRIRPKSARFSEALSHRDFLGALLHLGLERDSIGDILHRTSRGADPRGASDRALYQRDRRTHGSARAGLYAAVV